MFARQSRGGLRLRNAMRSNAAGEDNLWGNTAFVQLHGVQRALAQYLTGDAVSPNTRAQNNNCIRRSGSVALAVAIEEADKATKAKQQNRR